ncbi:MAG: DUF3006 domain-containing protein [Syntrophomonadaceae bacterium]|nr:DUF3006 domain-containing protein [Syntrophomonadaceae bacterium]
MKGEYHLFIIDRFEGEWAVVESGDGMFNLPRVLLPPKAKEGDVLRITVEIDRRATAGRVRRVEDLAGELFTDKEI